MLPLLESEQLFVVRSGGGKELVSGVSLSAGPVQMLVLMLLVPTFTLPSQCSRGFSDTVRKSGVSFLLTRMRVGQEERGKTSQKTPKP